MPEATPPPFLCRERVGLPPWAEMVDHVSVRYARLDFLRARPDLHPWTYALLQSMVAGVLSTPREALIDIRYWPLLPAGAYPGPTHWHEDDDGAGLYRSYVAGAGCFTEFFHRSPVPEGVVVEYTRHHRHRIQAATQTGPRLFVRVSQSRRSSLDSVGPPAMRTVRSRLLRAEIVDALEKHATLRWDIAELAYHLGCSAMLAQSILDRAPSANFDDVLIRPD